MNRCAIHFGLSAVWMAVAAVACSPSKTSDASSDSGAPACHAARQQEDGTWCGDGQFFDFPSGQCAPVGPPECASQLFAKTGACGPRWCAARVDAGGRPCNSKASGCSIEPRPCANAADTWTGCHAGEAPVDEGGCRPAGLLTGPLVGRQADAVPEVPPVPPPTIPRWCTTAAGAVPCDDDAAGGCAAGDVAQSGGPCVATDALTGCPKGFIDAKGTPGQPRPTGYPTSFARCAPDPKSCPVGSWATGLPKTGVIYVDASAPAGGDGTQSKPLRALAAAVKSAAAGATIALSAGEHAGPLVIGKPLSIVGPCAAKTRIVANGVLGVVRAKTIQAGILELRNLTIAGIGLDLLVDAPATVKARALFVDGSVATGVAAIGPGAIVALSDAVIRDVKPVGGASHALEASKGGFLSATDVRIENATDIGMLITGKSSRGVAERLQVARVRKVAASGQRGRGIEVNGGGQLTLTTGLVTGADEIGLRMSGSGSVATVRGLGIRCAGATGHGLGAMATHGSRLVLHGGVVKGCREFGIGVDDPGTSAELIGVAVLDTTTVADSQVGGCGVRAGGGAQLHVLAARIDRNQRAGVLLTGEGTHAILRDVLVRSTRSTSTSESHAINGHGVVVGAKATADIVGARLHDNHVAGLTVQNATAQVRLLVVDATDNPAPGLAGVGIWVRQGGVLHLRDSRVSANRMFGVSASGAGSVVTADRVTVDRTRAGLGLGESGVGIGVTNQASFAVRRSRISDHRAAGLMATVTGTFIDVTDTLIDRVDVEKSSNSGGHGVEVAHGAAARLRFSRITRCRAAGVLAARSGSKIVAIGVRVDNTRSDDTVFTSGMGWQVSSGAEATLAGCLVDGNHGAGVLVGHPGSHLTIAGSIVLGSGPDGLTDNGHGAAALLGAKMNILSSLFRDNQVAGVVFASSAGGSIRRAAIAATRQAAEGPNAGRFGDGVILIDAATVTIDESVATRNARGGIVGQASDRLILGRTASFDNAIGLARHDTLLTVTAANAVFGNQVSDRRGGGGLAMPASPQLIKTK